MCWLFIHCSCRLNLCKLAVHVDAVKTQRVVEEAEPVSMNLCCADPRTLFSFSIAPRELPWTCCWNTDCSCLRCLYISRENSNCTVQSLTSYPQNYQSNDQNHLHKRSLHKQHIDRKELRYENLVSLAQRVCWCYGWGFAGVLNERSRSSTLDFCLAMCICFCHDNLDTNSLMPATQTIFI